MEDTRVCINCNIEYPISEFKERSDRLCHRCRNCRNKYKRKWYRNHVKQHNDYQSSWRMNNPIAYKERYYGYVYGLSTEEHDRLFIKQDGRCAICGKDACELSRQFYVDHNHETGKVRGLLCHHCNIMIGFAEDKPELLLSAIKYLG